MRAIPESIPCSILVRLPLWVGLEEAVSTVLFNAMSVNSSQKKKEIQ